MTCRFLAGVDIDASMASCVGVLLEMEHYPAIFTAVERVEAMDDWGRWQWTIRGPEGELFSWVMAVEHGARGQDQVIQWETEHGRSDVLHRGSITLSPVSRQEESPRTRLEIVLEADPGPAIDQTAWHGQWKKFIRHSLQNGLRELKHYIEKYVAPPAVKTDVLQPSTKRPAQPGVIAPGEIPYSI